MKLIHYYNINIVLSKAVLNGGTTIKDYKQPNGKVDILNKIKSLW